MVNIILFIIFLFKSTKQKNIPKMIEVFFFTHYPENKLIVFVGDQPIQFRTTINLMDQNSCFILNENTHYSSSKSSIINSNKKLILKKYTIIGKEIEDLFSFEDDNFGPQIRLRFDFIDNDPSSYYLNRISLPFEFENEAYSIVHQMKYQGIIDHLSFSKIKLNIVSYFYFRGIPDEYITNNTVISHCDVIGNNSYWDCLIKSITIRNNSKVYTFELHPGTVAVFDFEKIFIYAPSNFIDFLLNTIFKDDLEKGNCSVADYSFRRLTCKTNIAFKIGNITFVIGEYNYTIGFEQFIKCSIGICFLDILDNPDGNYWKLGSLFFESFDVLFDYEQKKIFFYSTQGVELSQTRQYYNLNKILYFVISSIIMLCGIILTLSLKNYIKTTK